MPEMQATLCYVVKDSQVLLIRKKRGIGAGKINGPGGKVDPGESPLAAAVRETQEETGITPLRPQLGGELRFVFADGLTLHCHVYLAQDFVGYAHETAEAVPQWVPVEAIPYGEMWEDDQEWLPLLLSGQSFSGTIAVDGERVISQRISIIVNE